MNSAVIWGLFLALGVAAVVLGAAADQPALHMALTALACLAFAVAAVWERRRLVAAGVGETLLASSTARSMALVWAWAALSLLLTYVFVLSWIEWWQYVLGAGAIAGLCLFFASMLSRDAAAGREDQSLLKLARYLTLGQLVGMIIAMVGLVLDDKMPRGHEKPDWAASTIFFFGAASLAVISANALRGAPLQKS
jgi:FtsH-binding integral membrane protein